jgi:hypothetical protein
MQRKESVASTRFLAAQFHELWSRPAAVRVGRPSTLSCRWDGRNAGGKADIEDRSLATPGFGAWAAAVQRETSFAVDPSIHTC